MSRKETDVGARLAELEATVRGLTQELVEANERIRVLEDALEEGAAALESSEALVLSGAGGNGGDADGGEGSTDGEGSTRQMGDDRKAKEEAGSDLDDIIVA